MTSELFMQYLIDLNEYFKSQSRNIALLLDNAPCHKLPVLSNIKCIFLPANCTAGTQPLDAGIIKNFKYHYRCSVLNHMLCHSVEFNSQGDIVQSINLSHAATWILKSWEAVSTNAIVNCFRSCGITKYNANESTLPETEIVHNELEIIDNSDIQFDEGQIITCEEEDSNWEKNILMGIYVENSKEIANDDEDEVPIKPNLKQLAEACNIISTYILLSDFDGLDIVSKLDKILNDAALVAYKQKKITSYFANI